MFGNRRPLDESEGDNFNGLRGNALDDRFAINTAKTELREGFNNADIDRILSVFADGFTDMSGGQATFFGIDAKTVLRARLEKLFHDHMVDLAPIVMDIAIAGDVAVEYGWHVLTLHSKAGGTPEVKRTRYATMWNRDSDLRWRVVFFMDNADQKPELVDELLLKLSAAPATFTKR
jgi:ketosteroid isomerase-like protein